MTITYNQRKYIFTQMIVHKFLSISYNFPFTQLMFQLAQEFFCCLIKALSERMPQMEKRPRSKPMLGKTATLLCVTSFLVGFLLSGRVWLLQQPKRE